MCLDAAYELVEFPEPDEPVGTAAAVSASAHRACLCFAQQMVDRDDRSAPSA